MSQNKLRDEKLRTMYGRSCDLYISQKGQAKNAALLKRLTSHHMLHGADGCDHINDIIAVVDKLGDMGIEIHKDLQSAMLLSSLSDTYENCRCAMESCDELPDLETSKIKILETVLKKENDEGFLVSLNNMDMGDSWLLDSGCTHHVCKKRGWFKTFEEVKLEPINTAAESHGQSSAKLEAKGIGDIEMKTFIEERLESHNISIKDSALWHHRLCHIGRSTIERTAELNRVRGLENTKLEETACGDCCADVCGPMPSRSLSDKQYFITFADDYSRHTTVAFIKSKDEVKDHIKKYIAKMELQTGKKIKRFRSDNGTEYCNKGLQPYFEEKGIKHDRFNVEK
ncbi:uncharacterized protein LOC143362182 [Halictus rubicundus]|uniref:uncharacterized protein LOC143362182 n=1 Tax=Halictus rubicundus TaxID=77578 RepID=UPI00403750D3